ncbi:hypothetical protein HDV02_004669 [Globomyces sp. JEL0801]|nr:hypothetical protein HDV02_004669 [Globomyces sp. JEL0801]
MNLQFITVWLLAYLTTSKLIGVQFDVEPHTLPQWPADATRPQSKLSADMVQYLGGRLVNLYQNISKIIGNRLEIHGVIPFSYQMINITINGKVDLLSNWVQLNSHKLLIMAYRSNADAIRSLALPTINYATKINKKVLVAVEVKNILPTLISFHIHSNQYLADQLKLLHSYLVKYPGYQGQCIHDYNAMILRPNVTDVEYAYGDIRSIIVWDPNDWLVAAQRKILLDFITQSNINLIYLGVGNYINTQRVWATLRTFVYITHAMNVNVIFLYGAATWVIDPTVALNTANNTLNFWRTL